jgi:hypothetical protein
VVCKAFDWAIAAIRNEASGEGTWRKMADTPQGPTVSRIARQGLLRVDDRFYQIIIQHFMGVDERFLTETLLSFA